MEGARPLPGASRVALAQFPSILAQVADAFMLSEQDILGSRRVAPAPAARWVIAYALTQQGATIMDAARVLGRDHSTFCHGLTRLWQLPQAAQIAARFSANPWIKARVAIRQLPPVLRRPIAAYARALAGRREDRALCYRGLCLCCRSALARQAVTLILEAQKLGPQAGRMQMHARQAGLRWVA